MGRLTCMYKMGTIVQVIDRQQHLPNMMLTNFKRQDVSGKLMKLGDWNTQWLVYEEMVCSISVVYFELIQSMANVLLAYGFA